MSANIIRNLLFFVCCLFVVQFTHAGKIEEGELLTQKEEGFRYRDNLTFSINGRILDFSEIHESLHFFERECSRLYLEKVDQLKSKVNSFGEDPEEIDKWKEKNIATFGMSLLIQDKEGVKCVTLSPAPFTIDGVHKKNPLNVSKIVGNLDYKHPIFISGYRLPFYSYKKSDNRKYHEEINEINLFSGRVFIYSLEESINNSSKKSNSDKYRVDYLIQDLYRGYSDAGKNYSGIFSEYQGDWAQQEIGRTVRNALRDICATTSFEDKKRKITAPWNKTWGASLVDSEQSLRVYFQNNIKKLVIQAKKTYLDDEEKSVQQDKPDNPQKGKKPNPPKKILGLVLHVHSRMDLCEVCTASLYYFMRSCNEHSSSKDDKINGKNNYLWNNLRESLEGDSLFRPDRNFRFRITVSCGEPYVKTASVSRRNWAGKDGVSLQNMAMENLNFHDDDIYFAHKAYFDRGDNLVVPDRIRGLPGFSQLLPDVISETTSALTSEFMKRYLVLVGQYNPETISNIIMLVNEYLSEKSAIPPTIGSSIVGSSSSSRPGTSGFVKEDLPIKMMKPCNKEEKKPLR